MSLLRTATRAAVAASVIGNVQRGQQRRWAQQDHAAAQQQPVAAQPAPQQPAAAPATSADAVISQLQKLAELRDAGILTNEEFEAQKQRVLAS